MITKKIHKMKKLTLTLALLLGLSLTTFADGGGLFKRGADEQESTGMMNRGGGFPGIPGHGETGDVDAPLGSGALLLIGFGAAYALKRRQK